VLSRAAVGLEGQGHPVWHDCCQFLEGETAHLAQLEQHCLVKGSDMVSQHFVWAEFWDAVCWITEKLKRERRVAGVPAGRATSCR
jgi:hypothetical protein